MTAWQEASSRLGQSGGGETTAPEDPWEQASAPAKVAKRVIEGVFDRQVPASKIPLLTNVMHWGYGTSWGAVYGVIGGSAPGLRPLRSGLLFGAVVWAMSYVELVPMGLYQPPWKYSPGDLGLEISYHLVYGATVGAGYALAAR